MLQKTVSPQLIAVTPLTQSEFGLFGTVLENPATSHSISTSCDGLMPRPQPILVNQGTALKYPDISTMENMYKYAPHQKESRAAISMFVCSPQPLVPANNQDKQSFGSRNNLQGFLDLPMMERHPYTTQTFIPLGLDPSDTSTAYLVVVAPTIPSPAKDAGLPDVPKIRAFMARGSQAVTYGVGIWHAPMTVVGGKAVDFVVVQHVNGVSNDDCDEIRFLCTQEKGLRIHIIPKPIAPCNL